MKLTLLQFEMLTALASAMTYSSMYLYSSRYVIFDTQWTKRRFAWNENLNEWVEEV